MGPRGHRQPWWFSGRTRPAIVLGAPTCCSGGIPGRISQGKAGGRGPGKPGAGCRGASCSAPAVPSHRTARLPDSKWSQARETLPVREARWRRSARGLSCGMTVSAGSLSPQPSGLADGKQRDTNHVVAHAWARDPFLRENVGGKLLETQGPRSQPRTVRVSRIVVRPGMWALFCTLWLEFLKHILFVKHRSLFISSSQQPFHRWSTGTERLRDLSKAAQLICSKPGF